MAGNARMVGIGKLTDVNPTTVDDLPVKMGVDQLITCVPPWKLTSLKSFLCHPQHRWSRRNGPTFPNGSMIPCGPPANLHFKRSCRQVDRWSVIGVDRCVLSWNLHNHPLHYPHQNWHMLAPCAARQPTPVFGIVASCVAVLSMSICHAHYDFPLATTGHQK